MTKQVAGARSWMMSPPVAADLPPAYDAAPLTPGKQADVLADVKQAAVLEAANDDASLNALFEREAARYAAMSAILADDGPFAQAMSARLLPKIKPLLDLAGEKPESEPDTARKMVGSIFDNRSRDAAGAAALLRDPQWRQQALAGLSSMPEVSPETDLSAEKQRELRESLLGNRADHPEPEVHVDMTALGHRIGHRALAEAFDPAQAGPILVAELKTALPADNPDALADFANRWLTLRSTRAAFTAEATALDSPLMKETLALGESRRAAIEKAAGQPSAAAPGNVIPQPFTAVPEGKVSLLGRLRSMLGF